MNALLIRLRPLVAVCFVVFAGWNAYVVSKEGFASVFPPFASLAQLQMFTDLGVALAIVQGFVFWEAKTNNRPPWVPFAVLLGSVLLGSMSPLLYLLLLGGRPHRPEESPVSLGQGV